MTGKTGEGEGKAQASVMGWMGHGMEGTHKNAVSGAVRVTYGRTAEHLRAQHVD